MQCDNNSLNSLDVTQNTALVWLHCFNNSINSLDVTQNTALTRLWCQSNSLTTLNIANGNNGNISGGLFDASSNPSLTCIQVDDATWSTTNWTNIDATASFSTNCSVGIDEQANNIILSLYPNPVNNQMTIEIEEQIGTITIMDVMGKTIPIAIGTITTTNNTINVSGLTKGIYFLQVQTDKGLVSKKFIKE